MSLFSNLRTLGLLTVLTGAGPLLIGCGGGSNSFPLATQVSGLNVGGAVRGGQQPIAGASVQLYAVGTGGDDSAATALLPSPVVTDQNGNFSITGQYSCASFSADVYLVASGGNPGLAAGTNNRAIVMMSALGPCGSLSASQFVTVNEVSTAGSVAALFPYMSSATNLGSGSADATALASAFSAVNLYINTATGAAPGPSLPPGYSASTAALNTLANAVASCVNSTGGSAGDLTACGNLFAAATPSGGSAPTDTTGALIDILKNPNQNVGTIFSLSSPTGPFQPTLPLAPANWSLPIAPSLQVFTLSITVLGPGTGHVVSSPAGIDCGGTCSASFPAGTSVTLTATPAPTPFTGWTGNAACSTGVVVLSAAINCTATFNPGSSIASFNGTKLIVQRRNVDGSLAAAVPFLMQGVDWSPASTTTATTTGDSNNATVRRPEFAKWANIDVPLIAAMNANTVRLLIDPGNDQDGIDVQQGGWRTLDTLYRNNIMVIMTVDDAVANMTRINHSVTYYRNHPAVLMFSLGSEWNINNYFGVATSVVNAASLTEQSALLIKSLDSNHPVATSYGDIAINAAGQQLSDTQNYVTTTSKDVDAWGLNIYRGDNFGTLFQQWDSITTKPMFLGEFGADAFHSTSLTNPPPGQVNEAEQAGWDISLWNDLLRNSSSAMTQPAVGGTVFEWNDEWWKCFTAPSQGSNNPSQSSCGYPSGGFPDGFSNEAYSGIVDIYRTTRQAYSQFKTAFAPGYTPTPQSITFTATSAGSAALNQTYFCAAGGAFQGAAEFDKGHTALLQTGGGACGGRGFSVAAINPASDDLISYPASLQTFDTWASRNSGVAMNSMISFINSVPNGTILLIAVADEAGLNNFPASGACTFTTISGPLVTALQGLGSMQIQNLCYQGSFAMITVKGNGLVTEQVANTATASVQATF